jgi:Tfp pilus assembly protein PilO
MLRPTVIIIAAAAVGLFFVHLKPSYAVILELRDEEKQVRETVDQFNEATRGLERVRSMYQNISPQNLSRLSVFLQEGFDASEFVLYIHRIASNYGLTITSFNITTDQRQSQTQTKGEVFEKTLFNFNVEAPYSVFVAFMQDVERSLRPLDVADVQFTAGDEDRYDFAVTLQTYWLAP